MTFSAIFFMALLSFSAIKLKPKNVEGAWYGWPKLYDQNMAEYEKIKSRSLSESIIGAK